MVFRAVKNAVHRRGRVVRLHNRVEGSGFRRYQDRFERLLGGFTIMVYRVYVEKKKELDVYAKKIQAEIKDILCVNTKELRCFMRYDAENISKEDFDNAVTSVFSDPPIDDVYFDSLNLKEYKIFGVEFLPGQYDQRSDLCEQCVQILNLKNKPTVKCAKIYAVLGCKELELEKIKSYLINPVECRLANLEKPQTLQTKQPKAEDVKIVQGFIKFSDKEIAEYHQKFGFAMTVADLIFVRDYFKKEGRDPFDTELKVLDTYWSDHCRHSTFFTEIKDVKIQSKNADIESTYNEYKKLFKEINAGKENKYQCLMDIATIGAKKLKIDGLLKDLDESPEINACSINAKIDVNGQDEDYIVMFKNETHNHPTEIEPYGGASTCLGGGIRDPLSGRVYVHHAMRITGAADPTVPYDKTLKGKLPQRVLTTTACAGFSSYGNQIGLSSGQAVEIYHPNFVAKRMEAGFLTGANKKENIRRENPQPGDVIILLGGKTGRDGCGGATSSSKSHSVDSKDVCSAEVQKGNPYIERNIVRLFNNKDAARLIKKCNDFGAGGVSVAIGELADSLEVDLDKVPAKYEGLSGTELSISESQERMAIVVAGKDAEKFIQLSNAENLDAVVVAKVTDTNRLIIKYRGKVIVDLKRDFLNTNGVRQQTNAELCDEILTYTNKINEKTKNYIDKNDLKAAMQTELSRLNVCSQKGMAEYFDSTINAASVYSSFGGKNQTTPILAMAAKVPTDGFTNKCTLSSFGYNPYLMEDSPYAGAMYSVLISLSKIAASGGDVNKCYLSFQEYFKRLKSDPKRWGVPMSALLGALKAQLYFKTASIGGKDSMSGTFMDIDVPNTLISFAITVADSRELITNVLTGGGKTLYKLSLKYDKYNMPDLNYAKKLFEEIYKNIKNKNVNFATIVEEGGAFAAVLKSCFGNSLGFEFDKSVSVEDLFKPKFGEIIISCSDITKFKGFDYQVLGKTTENKEVKISNTTVTLEELFNSYTGTLENIFKTTAKAEGKIEKAQSSKKFTTVISPNKFAASKVCMPVFIGTNCEYDIKRAFLKAGAKVEEFLFLNRNQKDIENSIKTLASKISECQILVLPGGYSGGDEPNASKFIYAVFSNPQIKNAVQNLLEVKKGLMLGISSGFQALLRLGLLPFSKISDIQKDWPQITFNAIGRHISAISNIAVTNNFSPWLSSCKIGEVYSTVISHGEGRFVCDDKHLKALVENGQIATQYVDLNNKPTMQSPYNPNGSVNAIEGITSADGRIFGKMGHIERIGENLYKNFNGNFDMKVFESGVKYFK